MEPLNEACCHLNKLKQFFENGISECDPNTLYTTYKGLRDTAIKCHQFDDEINLKNDLMTYTIHIINTLSVSKCESFIPALGQALQFIHNLTVQNTENQCIIWERCKDYFKNWMALDNEKLRNYVCGTLYNISLGKSDVMVDILNDTLLVNKVFESALKGTDFAILITEKIQEHLTENSDKFIDNYLRYDSSCYVQMLHTLNECVKTKDVNIKLVEWVKDKFKTCTQTIQFNNETKSSEYEEFYTLLKILVTFSSNEKHNPVLQEDLEMIDLKKTVLEKLHNQGRSSLNDFTPTEDILTERTPIENIKTNLIRLLGNLSWRCKPVQDRLRQISGLPLILDCCIRDGRNPFITETVVFAVRNLCEGNVENQKFIREMNETTHQGMSERAQNWSSVFSPQV